MTNRTHTSMTCDRWATIQDRSAAPGLRVEDAIGAYERTTLEP
jgi:hypothetical protein